MQQIWLCSLVTLRISRTTLIVARKLLQFLYCHSKAASSAFSPHYKKIMTGRDVICLMAIPNVWMPDWKPEGFLVSHWLHWKLWVHRTRWQKSLEMFPLVYCFQIWLYQLLNKSLTLYLKSGGALLLISVGFLKEHLKFLCSIHQLQLQQKLLTKF